MQWGFFPITFSHIAMKILSEKTKTKNPTDNVGNNFTFKVKSREKYS